MIDPESHGRLRLGIALRLEADRAVLDGLRAQMRPLRGRSRLIQERGTTALSLVVTDGGNNHLRFDPFLVQLVRVVDSSNNEYVLDAITPSTDLDELSIAQREGLDGRPTLMGYLGDAA